MAASAFSFTEEQETKFVERIIERLARYFSESEVFMEGYVRRETPTLHARDVFPYEIGVGNTVCKLCSRTLKEHSYVDFMVSESHESKIRDWFDEKRAAMAMAENLLLMFASLPNPNVMTEKERISFLREIQEKHGGRMAEEWQRLLLYHSQEMRLLAEMWYGGAEAISQVRNMYSAEVSFLQDALEFDYSGNLEEFKEDYERASKTVYRQIREEAENLESMVEGHRKRMENLRSQTKYDWIRLMAAAKVKEQGSEMTAQTKQPQTASQPSQ